jgi:hypothetical protein
MQRVIDVPIHDLRRYLTTQFERVEGWCWKYTWQPLEFIDARQRELGAHGPIAEIGVFRGRFFIGLASLKSDACSHLALDVFDLQEFSMSGSGTRINVPKEISNQLLSSFRDNIQVAGIRPDAVTIIRRDSVSTTAREIERQIPKFQKFLFFSIDGCHEYTHAYHDLNLALELTATHGLILVDDYLNARWPGAQEAVAKLYFGSAPRFVPLYYVYNKLALCHVNLHQDYFEGLVAFYAKNYPKAHVRAVTRYGWRTLTIEPSSGLDVLVGLPENEMGKAI